MANPSEELRNKLVEANKKWYAALQKYERYPTQELLAEYSETCEELCRMVRDYVDTESSREEIEG